MRVNDCLCAFADDTAMVVCNYGSVMPTLSRLFDEFAAISALSLTIKRTIFIPLWRGSVPTS
eukprot:10693932-Karenia_brevis.AAC.1